MAQFRAVRPAELRGYVVLGNFLFFLDVLNIFLFFLQLFGGNND